MRNSLSGQYPRSRLGLYKQPNDWTCGPFALKHALVAMGKLATEKRISALARPHWWSGTDEVGLARAARAFDCDLPLVRRTDPGRARRALTRYLSQRIPVLLCVDNLEHWITAVRHEGNRFVIIDSKQEPVLNVVSWPALRNRWKYTDEEFETDYEYEGDVPMIFDLHPVKPRFRVQVNADFSVKRAQYLRRKENRNLALHWDEYLGDLLEICRPPTTRATSVITMNEFLRRYQELLISRLVYWHGGIERQQAMKLLRNFRFVAETYGLVIPTSGTRRAIADLSILLSLWTAASHGVGEMYGYGGNHKKKRKR